MRQTGEYGQNKRLKVVLFFVVLAVVLAMVLAIYVVKLANSYSSSESVRSETVSAEVSVDAEKVQNGDDLLYVDTPFCQLSYPAAFSDLIVPVINEEKDAYEVSFETRVSGSSVVVYSIWFGGQEGSLIGTLELESSEKVEVRLETAEDDVEGLQKEDLDSYYAAKDTLNDVVASIAANERFVQA